MTSVTRDEYVADQVRVKKEMEDKFQEKWEDAQTAYTASSAQYSESVNKFEIRFGTVDLGIGEVKKEIKEIKEEVLFPTTTKIQELSLKTQMMEVKVAALEMDEDGDKKMKEEIEGAMNTNMALKLVEIEANISAKLATQGYSGAAGADDDGGAAGGNIAKIKEIVNENALEIQENIKEQFKDAEIIMTELERNFQLVKPHVENLIENGVNTGVKRAIGKKIKEAKTQITKFILNEIEKRDEDDDEELEERIKRILTEELKNGKTYKDKDK